MALTLAARMTAKILDGLNVEALTTAYVLLDPGIAASALLTLWQEWLADVNAMTDGQITQSWISLMPALPDGLNTAPTDASRVEQTGILAFTASGGTNRWGFPIPALSISTSVASGGKIVLTSGDPASNLINFYQTGGASFAWSNANGQAPLAFKDSLILFRQHHRQLASATYET